MYENSPWSQTLMYFSGSKPRKYDVCNCAIASDSQESFLGFYLVLKRHLSKLDETVGFWSKLCTGHCWIRRAVCLTVCSLYKGKKKSGQLWVYYLRKALFQPSLFLKQCKGHYSDFIHQGGIKKRVVSWAVKQRETNFNSQSSLQN